MCAYLCQHVFIALRGPPAKATLALATMALARWGLLLRCEGRRPQCREQLAHR